MANGTRNEVRRALATILAPPPLVRQLTMVSGVPVGGVPVGGTGPALVPPRPRPLPLPRPSFVILDHLGECAACRRNNQ
jgi:hypothetical protein